MLAPAVDTLKTDVSNALARATLKLAMDALKNTIDLIEANGDSVGGDAQCCPMKARTRKKKVAPIRDSIRAKMLNDFENGTTTPERLEALDRKVLVSTYGDGASRTTVVDALNEARREWESRQIATNDKS